MPAEMSRRRFVQASGVAITAGTLIGLDGPAAQDTAAATAGELARDFARPASAVRPKFRWWWPHGLVDPAEIRREVDRIADAGFGGAEIADVHHSVTEPMDPKGHGWGTPAWVAPPPDGLIRVFVAIYQGLALQTAWDADLDHDAYVRAVEVLIGALT